MKKNEKKNKPRVAIVIPTFNRSQYVQKTIETSIAQTYPCEVIVCDHGSTDNTPKIMKSYGGKIKYFRREEDSGALFCWLDGIMHTDAEFIHLQFDDDWISENYIEECMKLMENDVGVVIANVGDTFHFKKIFKKTGIFNRKRLEKILLRGVNYSPAACLYRRKDLIDALYMGDLPLPKHKGYNAVGPDSFVTFLSILRYKKVGIITEPLVFFRAHKGSITTDAHGNMKKYLQLKNAYADVLEYYMFLKWFRLFDKFKYFSLKFWFRKFTHLIKLILKKVGLLDFVRNLLKRYYWSS